MLQMRAPLLVADQRHRSESGSSQPRRRNREEERLNTRLLDAAQVGDLNACVRLLLAEPGANVNAKCRDSGATVMIVSSSRGYHEFVKFLLGQNASPLLTDNKGRTPLHIAAALGYEDVVRVILENETSKYNIDDVVNARVKKDGDQTDQNLSFDSWIHQHDTLLPREMPELSEGSTPLHAASQWSQGGCVELLLNKNADPELCDARGLTALDVAGEVQHRVDERADEKEIALGAIQEDDESNEKGERYTGFALPARQAKSSYAPDIELEKRSIGDEIIGEHTDEKSTTRNVIKSLLRVTKRKSIPSAVGLPSGAGLPGPLPDDDQIIPKRFDKRTKPKGKLTSCLRTAVENKDEGLIKYIIRNNLDIYQFDEKGLTPAHIAVEMKDLRTLSVMLDIPKVVDSRDIRGRSLLYFAVEIDWTEGVDFLLNANADVKLPANDGSTVVHVAARKKDSIMLEEIFTFDDALQVINYLNNEHQTPIWCAVEESSSSCVEFLIDHGAKLHPTELMPGDKTLLHEAAFRGSDEILELLLDKGGGEILLENYAETSFEYRGRNHKINVTPLHVSCIKGHTKCVQVLLDHGADVFKKTKTNDLTPRYDATPLHLAARYGHLDAAEEIINFDKTHHISHHKSVVEEVNKDLWEPLHVAARFGKTDIVKLLIKSGSNLSTQISDGSGYHKTGLDMIVNFIPQPLEFLQEIFDSYIETNEYPVKHVDCIVTFNFDLFTPNHSEKCKQLSVLEAVINSPKLIIQEVLLLHPLAETFLFLKWKKLRVFFFLMFALYCLFTISLTAMCLNICTDCSKNYFPGSLHLYRFTTVVTMGLVAFQEVFQGCRLQRYYWTDAESWVKWTTLVMAGFLSLPDFHIWWEPTRNSPSCFTNVSSVAVLLAWLELLFLLSRLPNWGFSVLMFFKVAQNVIRVLATFTFLFIGFMFAFMIEFKTEPPFSDFWTSLVKVVVMTSELEYSDMFSNPAETGILWSIVSRCILVSFVILITIVLMNLMVGVAVNDITLLEAQGRTRRLAKQVSFLSLMEMFVYNQFLLKLLPKGLRRFVKRRRRVSLELHLWTGKPLEMKRFPTSLRTSIIDKVCNIQKTDDKSDLKQLSDKIDKLIKQHDKPEEIKASYTSLVSVDTEDSEEVAKARRNVTLSLLQQVASTLQEVKVELNNLKIKSETERTTGATKWHKSSFKMSS